MLDAPWYGISWLIFVGLMTYIVYKILDHFAGR